MKAHKLPFYILLSLFIFTAKSVSAQRPMEKLDRGLVAQKVSNGVYINWRISPDEWYDTYYKIYRDGNLIYTTTTSEASNYIDISGNTNSVYTISSVKNGIESGQSKSTPVLTNGYLEIPLRQLGKSGYTPNDATAADLDGDGQYEIILKRLNLDYTVGNDSNFTYFEAYKLDGTLLWSIDVGPNILSSSGVEIDIAAFDFDGDGKAEVFMRTSEGTIFGDGTKIGDTDGDGITNYRYSVVQSPNMQYMNEGPEFLSLIDGETGKELDRVNFIPRGNSSDWGDTYGHRANKFFFGAPYLDGLKPSLFIGRGIYTMTKMQTYDVVNKKLVKKWYWECTSPSAKQQGKYDSEPKTYFGQGYHNYTIADVDGDGCDEINWGSMTIDNDGKPLYSTELGHGDAQHYGDLDPYRKGQEAFACNEDNPGTNFRDAKTGKILYRHITASDCGRCCTANITDKYKGAEAWGGAIGIATTDLKAVTPFGVAENFRIYWDGDLLEELTDHANFSTSTGVGYGQITKFIDYGNIQSLLTTNSYSCNYTKGTPNLQADIFGDWREEVIWWRPDGLALRIYTTPIPTTHRIYSLMYDHQYRQAICWQMCGYNQPPHASFYLGNDFPTPIPPKATNGKLVWNGNSSLWNVSSTNWMNGDDAAGLIAGTSPSVSYTNGKEVLFDGHSSNYHVTLSGNLAPENVTVSNLKDYTIEGTGSLIGTMRLDKMGDSTLVLNGTHSYTGETDVWEGNLWMNGNLSSSPVIIRRHANYGGNGTSGNGISTEYNAGIYVGGKEVPDSMIVNGTLDLVEGAKLIFDLSDDTTKNPVINDYLIVDGTLKLDSASIININQIADSLSNGKYILAKVNALDANLNNIKINGTIGVATQLEYDASKKYLYLVVKGTRSATNISWTGLINNNWDVAATTNWNNLGTTDIFVSGDNVTFDDSSNNKNVNILDSIIVGGILVDNTEDYTFGGIGSLMGNMNLIKMGEGILNINNKNSYTGKTIISGGTLNMQYAPTSGSNGAIGLEITDPSYFVVKDGAQFQILTGNTVTARGLTVDGENGGVVNVASSLYWNGIIQGTKLTKTGDATLYISNNNNGLNETVLKSGTINLYKNEAVQYGIGKKITFEGGTLTTVNYAGSYLTSNHDIEVPTGETGTFFPAPRCEYNGKLTGEGTLNWYCDFIRAYINGNWSEFSGILNIYANGANSTSEDHFIVNNSAGFPNATINLGTGVMMCYKSGTSDNGTSKIKVGMLTGVNGAKFYNADLEVGNNNTSGTYSGEISGVTAITKVGTGTWTINGTNSYTGKTTIDAGKLNVYADITGTGIFTVNNGASAFIKNNIAGTLIINKGGSVTLYGTVSSSLSSHGELGSKGTVTGSAYLGDSSVTKPNRDYLGTATFNSDVTMGSGAKLVLQVSGGTTLCDLINIGGTLTCNGTLEVSLASGVFKENDSYQILKANTTSGTFSNIVLPELTNGLTWDLSELYTSGTIRVKSSTGIDVNKVTIGVKTNPTTGKFTILTGNNGVFNVIITDIKGKLIYKSLVNVQNETFDVNITNQSSGTYLLTAKDQYGKLSVLKLIKY